MMSQYLSGRTAILAAALCSLGGTGACDVPTPAVSAVSAEGVGTGLISGALSTAQDSIIGMLASFTAAVGDDPPDLANPTAPQEQPDPNELYIEDITTNGKGCPKGDPDTVEYVISEDKKSFVIIYKDMELTNPPGPKVKNLSCQAAVSLHIPNGYQVALATVNTRGYLYLDEKIRARETSGYFFAGQPLGAYPRSDIVGPYDDFYEFSDNVPFESLVWSACGTSAIFGIKTTLNLNANANPGGQAIFSNDTTDGVFRTILHWQFRPCKP